jgi:hypothetical protein
VGCAHHSERNFECVELALVRNINGAQFVSGRSSGRKVCLLTNLGLERSNGPWRRCLFHKFSIPEPVGCSTALNSVVRSTVVSKVVEVVLICDEVIDKVA